MACRVHLTVALRLPRVAAAVVLLLMAFSPGSASFPLALAYTMRQHPGNSQTAHTRSSSLPASFNSGLFFRACGAMTAGVRTTASYPSILEVRSTLRRSCRDTTCLAAKGGGDENSSAGEGDYDGSMDTVKDMNPLARASWFAVEAFGKVFGDSGSSSSTTEGTTEGIDFSRSPESLTEALRRIELDNDRSYFLSGEVDRMAYAEDCVFSDPFVSFSGRDRFVDNLANLGSFITDYNAKVIGYDVFGTRVKTKIMVKLELNLPWKPILAWPWGVTYTIDPDTFLITTHEEAWDIEPWEGVKQIFRKPTVRISKTEA